MSDFKLHWEAAEGENEPFAELELPYCPRIGEKIWFEEKDEDENVTAEVTVLVEDVMHVVETNDTFAYVELTVSLVDRVLTEDDDLDERGCECGGVIPAATRDRIMQAAMSEIRKKSKRLDGVGMAPSVEM